VPDHRVARALIDAVGSPLLSTTLIPEGEDLPLNDAQDIFARYEHDLAAVVDGGACPFEPTTVVDLTGAAPQVVRRGRGDPAKLGL
jgi:tRNA A37 threonylcarbamoyladenosine synthetase subunit TsaC/SUA5/YrdC